MSYYTRLQNAFEGALKLPLNDSSKYILFSDCHRGVGDSNDNFLPNQTLYLAALRHYFKAGYTYIELGDGDELWENRHAEPILEIHNDVFQLLSMFHRKNRLYMIFGNHDMVKKDKTYTLRYYSTYPRCCCNNPHLSSQPLMPEITFYESIILESCNDTTHTGQPHNHNTPTLSPTKIYLTHGHQADLFNSTFWRLSRFLVRYVWKPLEHFGVLDPTSAAKNYTRKEKTERRLQHFAKQEGHLLIAGHTHRPHLSEDDPYYCNSGSCVHPYSITCLEIQHMHISLVKWMLTADNNMRIYVTREVLAGPFSLEGDR